jgi:hypothetical protein
MKSRATSSFFVRMHLSVGLLLASLTALSLSIACGSSQPTQPGPAAKSPTPNVSIVSMSVAAETLASGSHVYHVTVKLRESGGVAATIASIDLSFVNGSSIVMSAHIDRPISDSSNVVSANSTIDSRELTTTDNDPSHPHATSVTAKVNFTDGASAASSVSASADVPMSAAPMFAVSGRVMDDVSGGPVRAGSVQIVDGASAGKRVDADGSGNYMLSDLAAGSYTIRASANGYEAADRSVTVAQDVSVDVRLRRLATAPPPAPTPAPSPSPSPGPTGCAYTVSPPNTGGWEGGNRTATITRTSGTCSWQASTNVSWITFPGATSGSGSGTLTFTLAPNGLTSRSGVVTISWAGGSFNIQVQQSERPDMCTFTLSYNAQDLGNIPSAGGQFSVSVTVTYGALPCPIMTLPDVSWITQGNVTGTTYVFNVAPNPSPGTARTGAVLFTSPFRGENVRVSQK